jgi:hypothetical protein
MSKERCHSDWVSGSREKALHMRRWCPSLILIDPTYWDKLSRALRMELRNLADEELRAEPPAFPSSSQAPSTPIDRLWEGAPFEPSNLSLGQLRRETGGLKSEATQFNGWGLRDLPPTISRGSWFCFHARPSPRTERNEHAIDHTTRITTYTRTADAILGKQKVWGTNYRQGAVSRRRLREDNTIAEKSILRNGPTLRTCTPSLHRTRQSWSRSRPADEDIPGKVV